MFLAGLVALSLVGLIFRPGIWHSFVSFVQVLVPFQDATGRAADAVTGLIPSDGPGLSKAEAEAVLREREALRHQLVAISHRVRDLENENAVLTAIRLHQVAGMSIGAKGRLIPGRVIAGDMLPWPSSRLVDAGTLRGVKGGAAVASRHFSVELGEADGVAEGMAILLAEVFVGVVDSAGTHTCRVRLLSDPASRVKIRTGRLLDDSYIPGELTFWLEGRGDGVMEIRDIDLRDVESGAIAVGDIILIDPDTGLVPAPMTAGHIAKIETDVRNPLLGIATVESPLDESALRRVYVFDPNQPQPE
jgi:cell shape-determining protein MreC